ncbi:MAG: hypothetical protein D6805_07280 [Planctomycetota bacterium]|nr:MAG: hypothetical protein D6805_07280 [Planctomycetota bacterium]
MEVLFLNSITQIFTMKGDKTLKKLALFLICTFALLSGCAKPMLYPTLVDTSNWSNSKEGIKVAVINGHKKHEKASLEYRLASQLETYFIEDFQTNKEKYKSLAAQNQIPIPNAANYKPAPLRFFSRQQLGVVLQEQDFNQTDRVDPAAIAAKIGKVKGVDIVCIITCTLQMEAARKDQTLVPHEEVYTVPVKDKKTGKVRYERRTRTVWKPKVVAGRQSITVTQRLRVKGTIQFLNTSTSENLQSISLNSEIITLKGEYLEGEPAPKFDLKGAAEETLKSLAHKLGRRFYPIVMAGGFLADNSDPRGGDERLRGDLTWSGR